MQQASGVEDGVGRPAGGSVRFSIRRGGSVFRVAAFGYVRSDLDDANGVGGGMAGLQGHPLEADQDRLFMLCFDQMNIHAPS